MEKKKHAAPAGSRIQPPAADVLLGQVHGTFANQPISKPDSRYPETGVARPDEESVIQNKDWVDFNEK